VIIIPGLSNDAGSRSSLGLWPPFQYSYISWHGGQ